VLVEGGLATRRTHKKKNDSPHISCTNSQERLTMMDESSLA
jgi:hypothetical protein